MVREAAANAKGGLAPIMVTGPHPAPDACCTESHDGHHHGACGSGPAFERFAAAAEQDALRAAQSGPELENTPLVADFDPMRYHAAAGGSRRLLLRGGTILSMDPEIGDLARGDLLIEGTRIAAVAPRIEAEATVIDAGDMIVLPGFCDPHIHAWQGNLPRLIGNHVGDAAAEIGGTTEDADPTRNYRAVVHERFGPLYRPEDIHIGTLMSLLAALNGGITTVCDNAHNSRTPAHTDASIAALEESGVRGIHAFGRPRFGPHDGHFPNDAYRLRRDRFASGDGLLTMRMFVLGRDPLPEIEQVLAVRRDLDLWVTFDSGIGRQPLVELYADGRLDGRETINHGTFVSPEQMRAVVDHGATVNVCPRIESQFRFGDIPYQAWRDAGMKPAISNDDPVTYALNMFQEMRTLYAFQRAGAFRAAMAGAARVPELATVREMLEAATLRGAENCALADRVGSLTPGKQADIVMIDTGNVHLFPKHNALCTVVQGADVGFVDTVFVAGRLMKWRGELVGVDFARLRRELEASRDRLFAAAEWPLAAIDFSD